MLGKLEEEAQRDELKQQCHHADETREQIANLEQAARAVTPARAGSPSRLCLGPVGA
jgi:ferritin-like metal-binding protein YciE